MTRLLIDYFKEVLEWRRLIARLLSVETVVAGLVTSAFLSGEMHFLLAKNLKLSGFAGDMFRYSGMGMSAAVTVMALAARWADRDFSAFLRSQSEKHSADVRDYPEMMSRLSWTALCHWVGVILGLAATMFVDDSVLLGMRSLDFGQKVWGGVLIFTFCYTTMNFLSTVLVVSIMCGLRAQFMEEVDKKG